MSSILDALHAQMGGGAHVDPSVGGVPPALLGAIHAGPSAGGSPLPPELMAALGGGTGPAGEDDPGHEQNEVALLSKIIDDMHTFLKVAADEDDKATIATCLASIQKLKAKDQAETDGAMQGKTTPRMVRKTAASLAGPGGGI